LVHYLAIAQPPVLAHFKACCFSLFLAAFAFSYVS
jgi:hypothetical protein